MISLSAKSVKSANVSFVGVSLPVLESVSGYSVLSVSLSASLVVVSLVFDVTRSENFVMTSDVIGSSSLSLE